MLKVLIWFAKIRPIAEAKGSVKIYGDDLIGLAHRRPPSLGLIFFRVQMEDILHMDFKIFCEAQNCFKAGRILFKFDVADASFTHTDCRCEIGLLISFSNKDEIRRACHA